MTPDLVELIEEKLTQEQWSPDQISGRLAKDDVAFISHERIYQHVWKDKKDGGTLYLHLRHSWLKIQQAQGQEFGARADSEPRRYRSAASYCRRKKPHRRLGGRHDYRRQSQRRCHVARRANLQIHQARQTAGQERGLCRAGCACLVLPLADQIETITYDNGKQLASHAQIATSLDELYDYCTSC